MAPAKDHCQAVKTDIEEIRANLSQSREMLAEIRADFRFIRRGLFLVLLMNIFNLAMMIRLIAKG